MRRSLWLAGVVGVLLLSVPAVGVAGPSLKQEPSRLAGGCLWSPGAVEKMLEGLARASVEDPPVEPVVEPGYLQPGESGYKSPGRAFFMSLVLPGSGELYAGSMRGLAFLGIELLSWGGYVYYDGKGHDERTNYEAFADLHYEAARYRDVVNEICGKYENWPLDPDYPCQDCEFQHCAEDLDPGEGNTYSENQCAMVRGHFLLPDETGQHYYEDLGKYDKYIFGWDDWYEKYTFDNRRDAISWSEWQPGETWPTMNPPWDETVGMDSENREKYRGMRRQSNDYLDRATYFTWFVLINHVGSALNAAFSARTHNRRLVGEPTGMDVGMESRPLENEYETRIFVRKWF
ncbi:MAG: hypothetical protein KAW17_10975 [Candidatus Eisenbacteria sp.]|nr:hypothetical protein [Candidatus Eisenbacteria bacterium]